MDTRLFELCLLPFLILFVFIKNMKHLAPFSFFANIATLGGLLLICKLSCDNLVTCDKHWHHIWQLTCFPWHVLIDKRHALTNHLTAHLLSHDMWRTLTSHLTAHLLSWHVLCDTTCEKHWHVLWQLTCSLMTCIMWHVASLGKSSDILLALSWHVQ